MRITSLTAACIAVLLFLLPVYPAFITLTGVTPPGISLLSPALTLILFGLVIALVCVMAVALLRTPRTPAPSIPPLVCWLAAALLAAALGFDPRAGLVFLAIFGMGLIWHAAILRFYGDPPVARAVQWSLIVSGGAASLLATVMALARTPASLYAIGHGRAIGTFVLPGELAGYLIVFLPIAFAVARSASNAALRTAAWIALACGAAAFVLTFSRAGWIGLAAAIALYAIWSGAIRPRYAPLIVAGGVLAVLGLFNVHHNPAENYTRLSIWEAGLSIARRFPLTGVGPFDFARIYPLVRVPGGDAQAFHAHNIVLTLFAETGLIGVAAMLWAWWRFAVLFVQRLRGPSVSRTLALALAAGLAGTWVQGLIDTVSIVIFGLWLPAMALALAAAAPPTGGNE